MKCEHKGKIFLCEPKQGLDNLSSLFITEVDWNCRGCCWSRPSGEERLGSSFGSSSGTPQPQGSPSDSLHSGNRAGTDRVSGSRTGTKQNCSSTGC